MAPSNFFLHLLGPIEMFSPCLFYVSWHPAWALTASCGTKRQPRKKNWHETKQIKKFWGEKSNGQCDVMRWCDVVLSCCYLLWSDVVMWCCLMWCDVELRCDVLLCKAMWYCDVMYSVMMLSSGLVLWCCYLIWCLIWFEFNTLRL